MTHPSLLSRCPTATAAATAPARLLRSSSARLTFATRTPRHEYYTTQSRGIAQSSISSHRIHGICSIPSSQPLSSRLYHSQHHPDPPAHAYTNSQTTILSAALNHVPEHGFTLQSLTLGARDVGFLDVSVQLFPRREFDLILFWLASRRGLLRDRVENGLLGSEEGSGRSVEEKIKTLLLERLHMNAEIRHRWQDVCPHPDLPLVIADMHRLSH